MTARVTDLCDFVRAFEADIRRQERHLHHAPEIMSELRHAACCGDAREVSRLAASIRSRIRRERLWYLESLATARRQDARRQRFHDLAWGNA